MTEFMVRCVGSGESRIKEPAYSARATKTHCMTDAFLFLTPGFMDRDRSRDWDRAETTTYCKTGAFRMLMPCEIPSAHRKVEIKWSVDPDSPSVFGRNLQCKPVRGVNFREECHWSHAWKSFKQTCVGSNGILECKILSENAHRACMRPEHKGVHSFLLSELVQYGHVCIPSG
jgi:hypothetical protein